MKYLVNGNGAHMCLYKAMTRFIGTLICTIFGIFMLPVLISAYIILSIGEWSNGMLHLWKEEIDHWGKP